MSKNEVNFEAQLFKAADKLRQQIDAGEYKHIVLGLVFLKYISDNFEEHREKLIAGEGEFEGADPEDKDEYNAESIFWVPKEARWSHLLANAKQTTIGKIVDEAMDLIEKENPVLKGVLPKVYNQEKLDPARLGELVDLIGNIDASSENAKSKDVLGRVYEYFLGGFAGKEGTKGGQFYTPRSLVTLLVEMLEPYKGRVYDPCCGSGGMFIMSDKFVQEHEGIRNDISVYGQESNNTTYRLSRMNLAMRNIDASHIKWNSQGTFLGDAHPDLKADYIIANPPFNMKKDDWWNEALVGDARWAYGTPPEGNANYGWIQHMIYHLAPKGKLGFVMANGSLSSNSGGEGDIRQKILEAGLVDCIVALPKQLFYSFGGPACLWFISRGRVRTGETLFIDVSEMGTLEDRTHRVFTEEDIATVTETYHNWQKSSAAYEDVKGFCKSATLKEIAKQGHVLTPGRYVGIPDEVDDGIPFEQKMDKLSTKLSEQIQKERVLNEEIKKQLAKIGVIIDI